MIHKPTLHGTFTAFASVLCLIFAFSSCKKDASNLVTKTNHTVSLHGSQISTANYVWDELAINKKTESDSIQYDAAPGQIKRVVTYDNIGNLLRDVDFTYNGNKITLNTPYQDEYDLDSLGRVVYHSCFEVQQGHNIVDIDRYAYDSNGYLKQVAMSFIFDGQQTPVYENINYTVVNGNYTRYALVALDSNKTTREYDFSYDMSKTVKSQCSLFAPIFANETYSNIDKYLNYGKISLNALTGLDYSLINDDNSTSKGSFNVVTNVNNDGYITSIYLAGNAIAGFPSDNISPLPREINFSLK